MIQKHFFTQWLLIYHNFWINLFLWEWFFILNVNGRFAYYLRFFLFWFDPLEVWVHQVLKGRINRTEIVFFLFNSRSSRYHNDLFFLIELWVIFALKCYFPVQKWLIVNVWILSHSLVSILSLRIGFFKVILKNVRILILIVNALQGFFLIFFDPFVMRCHSSIPILTLILIRIFIQGWIDWLLLALLFCQWKHFCELFPEFLFKHL